MQIARTVVDGSGERVQCACCAAWVPRVVADEGGSSHARGFCLAEQLSPGELVVSTRSGERAIYVGRRSIDGAVVIALEASTWQVHLTDFSDWRRLADSPPGPGPEGAVRVWDGSRWRFAAVQESLAAEQESQVAQDVQASVASAMSDTFTGAMDDVAVRGLGATTESSSAISGALTISGGVNIGGEVYLGSIGVNSDITLIPQGGVFHGGVFHGERPANPARGTLWYDQSDFVVRLWDGSQWRPAYTAQQEQESAAAIERPMAPVETRRKFDLDA